MFKNIEQTLFTTSSATQPRTVNVNNQSQSVRQGNPMRPGGVSLANRSGQTTSMKAYMSNASSSKASDISMSMNVGVPQVSRTRVLNAPTMSNQEFSMARKTYGATNPYGTSSYGQLAGSMRQRSNLGDLSMSMQNAGVGSSNNLGSSMGQTPFQLGMKYSEKRNAARSSNISMSASFQVSGSSNNNKVIDNYQDMSMAAPKRTVGGGWTSGAHVNAFSRKHGRTSRLVMMATPEGSWGDVKRQPVVGGNWKSNGDVNFVNSFPENVLNKCEFDASKMSVCVAPTDIHLTSVNFQVKDQINVMAQDVSQYPKGAYTGNVTADQLVDIGVMWTLTGHSERRTLHGESDEDVAKKTKAAIENGVTVMACIGEQLEERESGKTGEVNARQLKAIAEELTEAQWGHVVVAYEPVWAIGTGKVATPEQAEETHLEIREWLSKNVSDDVAGKTRILYGGSVNAGNCEELIKKPNIDGFLVGGASLKDDFKTIIESVAGTV